MPLLILHSNDDFEKHLVDSEYKDEIIKAIDIVCDKADFLNIEYIQKLNGTKGEKDKIRDYNGDDGFERALLDCMSGKKADLAEEIAEQIVKSDKSITPKIRELFDKLEERTKLNLLQHD